MKVFVKSPDIHDCTCSSVLTFPLIMWTPMQPATSVPILDLCTAYPLHLGVPRQCGTQFARHFYTRPAPGIKPQPFWSWGQHPIHFARNGWCLLSSWPMVYKQLCATDMHPSNLKESKHQFALMVLPLMQRPHSSLAIIKIWQEVINVPWKGYCRVLLHSIHTLAFSHKIEICLN